MDAFKFLQTLLNQPLCYGLKSPDTDLYDFGFGDTENPMRPYGDGKGVGTLTLHIQCRFKVIWKNGEQRVDRYYEDTPSEKFHSEVKDFIGMKVRQVALSDKNDLWLDLGDCWIVFVTFENGEESWRFFISGTNTPHLVASDSWLHFS